MIRRLLVVCFCFSTIGCAILRPDFSTNNLVLNNKYKDFDEKGTIYVKTIDGEIREYIRFKIVEVTDTHFTGEGWVAGSTEPESRQYKMVDTVIEVQKLSTGKIISFFVTIGILVALFLVSENNKISD